MAARRRGARCGAGMDRDESTTMDCDIAIYQTVYADADSDGPGSDRGRAHISRSIAYCYMTSKGMGEASGASTRTVGRASPGVAQAAGSDMPPVGIGAKRGHWVLLYPIGSYNVT